MFETNDSSDDSDEGLSKQALPAATDTNEPVDLDKMPTTGEEYLRQVRYGAMHVSRSRLAVVEECVCRN